MTKIELDHDRTGPDQLDPADHAARDAAHSWTLIGAALDTARPSAQQRFGTD